MIDTVEAFRQRLGELATAAWALTGLRSALESGLFEHLAEPRSVDELAARARLSPALAARLLDVLVALGMVIRDADGFVAAAGVRALLADEPRQQLLAELRSEQMQAQDLVERASGGAAVEGWRFVDEKQLEAQGVAGAGFARILVERIAPTLDGLAARLAGERPRFLDVGTGVAAFAAALCRMIPSLQVVGIDVWEPSLALARRRVREAGLEGRFELRLQGVEALAEREAFDLAWLPVPFLPEAIVDTALARVHLALRAGGWAIVPTLYTDGDELLPAVLRLKNLVWGGARLTAGEVQRRLEAVGFARVVVLPGQGWRPTLLAAQKRPA